MLIYQFYPHLLLKMKIMSNNSEKSFSDFGIYDLDDQIEFILPNTLIKFTRISDNAFSYYRENSEGMVIEKIIINIHIKTKILELNIHLDFFSGGIHSFITLVSIPIACLMISK